MKQTRLQTIVGLGMLAIGLTAFFLDGHTTCGFDMHQKAELAIAGIGLLLCPFNFANVKEVPGAVVRNVTKLRRTIATTAAPADSTGVPDNQDNGEPRSGA